MKRRNFLKNAGASVASTSFLSIPTLLNTPGFDSIQGLTEEDYWAGIKKMFPVPLDEAYFNTGTLGVQPTAVLNKVIESMRFNSEKAAECDYQGNGPLLLSGYEPYVEIRKKVGSLINADYKEITLTQNATFGMNYVSNGLDLKEGDEIINTDQEHGGGRAGWQVASARHNLVYKQAKIPIPANEPQQIIDSIFSEVTPKTRVIAVPHMISGYGVVLPVQEICAEAKQRGIFSILDGAQTVGHIPVDVKAIGCDAYFSSLHKWLLAPAGNGILYVDSESISGIWTTLASYQWENNDDPGFRLTQRGTGNPSLVIGLEAAIDFHNQIGSDKVTSRIKHLGDYLRNGLKEIDGVIISSSTHPEMCAGITTYRVEGITGPELQNEMWKREKLQPRSVGEEVGIRHSTHIYNLESEIDRALEVVRDLARG